MASEMEILYRTIGNETPKMFPAKCLKIVSKVGQGSHGNVFKGYWRIGRKQSKKLMAIKVFQDWPSNSETPFERETKAYMRIREGGLRGDDSGNKWPVVRAQGWGTLPAGLEKEGSYGTTFCLTQGSTAQFMVKTLVEDKPFNLKEVNKDEMMEDMKILGNLGIDIPDLCCDNFLGGKIVDLSSAEIVVGRIVDQSTTVKEIVLSYYGQSDVSDLPVQDLECAWNNLSGWRSDSWAGRRLGLEAKRAS